MKKKFIFWAFTLFVITSACAQSPQGFNALSKQLEEQYSTSTAGIALKVLTDSTTIWSGAFGMADVEKQEHLTTDHSINIGSVSKLFVATAILRLVDQNVLDLDVDVNQYIPFRVHHPTYPMAKITCRQLLTHRSSIQDSEAYDNSYSTGTIKSKLSKWLEAYLSEDGSLYKVNHFTEKKPGSAWQYSNIGYGLLALIVEERSGTPFDIFCQTHIFQPLGMENTAWKNPAQRDRMAIPYGYWAEEPDQTNISHITTLLEAKEIRIQTYLPFMPYSFPNYPDGLLYTSVEDLSQFAQAILNEGTYGDYLLLQPGTVQQMFHLNGEKSDKQGLCWRYTGMGNIWGHGGDDPGIQTGLYLDLDHALAMIMIKNSNLGSRTLVLKQLYQAARSSQD